MTTIDWRRCTDSGCACHSFENSGPRWTWTFERLIESAMTDAARRAGQFATSSSDEQYLWDAIVERMRGEMVASLVHGCPWKIAREVFGVVVVADRSSSPAHRESVKPPRGFRAVPGPADDRAPARRSPRVAA